MQESAPTPMFRQYRALKAAHPRTILLFRMGDFFEMFDEDAKDASRILDITLTARGKGTAHVAPMCGFPHHQLDAYTAKLVRAGKRVAICEQTEDPATAKGLVRREVVRIVTPGTLTDPGELDARENAWVGSWVGFGGTVGAAFLDASTGEFLAWQHEGETAWEALRERWEAFAPREIVHAEGGSLPEPLRRAWADRATFTPTDPFAFATDTAGDLLKRHLGVASLDGFGLRDKPAAIAAAGGLLAYLAETQRSGLEHVDALTVHEPARFVLLDPATRRNLELERSLRDGSRTGSLLHAIDATVTAPGARLLRGVLLEPLRDPAAIAARQDAIEDLVSRPDLRRELRERLGSIHDLERLVGRAVAGTAHARDLLAVRASLEALPRIVAALAEAAAPLLRGIVDGLDPCADVAASLAKGIVDEPPAGLRDGGIIRPGYHAELDELRAIRSDGTATLAAIEVREREATGIASLKVRFNKVFGYYIEISKSNLHLVPEHYHRKQTIAGGERFVTPELKDHESRVLRAQERLESLEYELFVAMRAEVARQAARLKAAAKAVAWLDLLAGLAETADRHGYRRPRVDDGSALRVVGGRHPVVEQTLPHGRFVANDVALDPAGDAISILTGPNMGGKSTYLRQVAIIALLAQTGSFVPADEAEIGIVDRIFCRVGASDSLAEGQSTFMVEMTETANILHHATARSLVLLDEIGRGTSTFDGLAIAWAVVEHLHARPQGRPRTLFATHYHELTELAVAMEGVVNQRMVVREWGEQVVFTHRVERGASDRSYGIHVARLAGIPAPVVERAREILANLERDEFGGDGLPRRAARRGVKEPPKREMPLFSGWAPTEPAEPRDPAAAEVLAELRSQDPDHLTPMRALELLHAWRGRLLRERNGGS